MKGTLYLVSTPVGNLKDITYRAIEVLTNVDIVFCEDTRVTIKLMNHYNIKKKLATLHKFNEMQKVDEFAKRLDAGENLALVSDAGTPLLSDPGIFIVPELLKLGYNIEPIPGASAILPAIQLSGLVKKEFLFLGFLPESNKELTLLFDKLINLKYPIFFYLSPHKVKKTLNIVKKYFGDIEVVMMRELTKKFEERIEGKISTILEREEYKGEIVVGFIPPLKDENYDIKKMIEKYKDAKFSTKDISKIVAIQTGIKKKEIYQLLLDEK